MNTIQPNKPVQPVQNKLTPEMREKILKKRKQQKIVRIAAIVAALIIILALIAGVYSRFIASPVKASQYQPVSLVNGQAYIGKLQNNPTSSYLKLTDVYTVQLAGQESEQGQAENQQNQQPQLVKLSDQLAGSEDEIYLNRDQVSFWENLRDDGKVTQAIKSDTKQ